MTTGKSDRVPARLRDISTVVGRNIASARKRRRLRQADVARMAGITLPTLRAVESGRIGTSIGAYLGVLWALGLEDSVLSVATFEADTLGQVHAQTALRRGVAGPRLGARLDDNF